MSTDIRKQIGSRIKRAREDLELTQRQLAEKLGKTQNTIASYESGTRTIRVTELPELAAALNVSMIYFFGDDFADQEMMSLISRLTPAFRSGALIFLRQQIELQNVLLKAVTKLGDNTSEAHQKAVKIVEANEARTAQEMTEEFTRIMLDGIFQERRE